ncbi:2,3-diphosphoglycerate-dependent phosphoglycerate mutase [Prevotella sp. oral taxon 299]|jgi:2,3-bisphosphoglycerate-dependent phosphoglycerate mutase|uniref:2,3-diphosphoglycerate-dependent phosphoglycerate mutase n=1 Tax=Prevotella sp. oral taxon 299 TaxID=652716 RepID=UPI0001C3F3CD|nr:2,3-diphosphoglycerate-dependent phosphoglycerate mutase [Prevotella sp. oral taxon 299]EFC70617.1 phosphoglycerate mutase 1 family protein [Prevotella sp. oral taxon 299 str. F0039]
MKRLVIVRHGESEWNQKNLFTGWVDVELSDNGREEAKRAGKALKEAGIDFDICFTSYLKRAINTQQIILKEMEREWLPVFKSYKLNERHYGALSGLNKKETAEKYGDDQVKIWRRSFDVRPPMMEEDNQYNSLKNPAYRNVDPAEVPMCESLKDTIARTVPYFEKEIKPLVMEGKRVMIAAHGNSLRSLIKYFENISDDEIINVEIPTGTPLVYEFDDNFNVTNKYYLGK